MSANTRIAADYQRSGTFTSSSAPGTTNLSYQESGVRLLHKSTGSLGYHLGYAYAGSGTSVFHHFRIGLDGRKALTRSRCTVFSFGTDSTLVTRPTAVGGPAREFRLLGNADLEHYFGRTWITRVSYRRDVTTLAGYAEPIFRDVAGAAVSGTFSRRTTAGATVAYALADVQSFTGDRDRARTGGAWLQVAVTPRATLFGEYSYYVHQLGMAAVGLALPPRFGRHGAQAGMIYMLSPRPARNR